MQIPWTNIKTSDIRNAIGESVTNLSGLCQSPNVNKWGVNIFGLAGVDPLTSTYIPPSHFDNTRKASQRLNILQSSPYKMGDFRYYSHTSSRTTGASPLYAYPSSVSPYNWDTPATPVEGGTYTFWVGYSQTKLKIIPISTWITAGTTERYGTYSSHYGRYIVREGLTFTVAEWVNPLLNTERAGTFEIWTDEGDGNDVKLKTYTIQQQSASSNYSISIAVDGVGYTGQIPVVWSGGSFVVDVTFSEPGIDWRYACVGDGANLTNYVIDDWHYRYADSPTSNNDGSFSVFISENTTALNAIIDFEIETLDGFYTKKVRFVVDQNPTL